MLVYYNYAKLKRLGIYEAALLHAFTATRTNNRTMPLYYQRHMFAMADRTKLRAAGSPLPGLGPFSIYRGVAGNGPARRIRGFSWTTSLDRAKWFAVRFALQKPAVYRTVVNADDVLACSNERREQEMVVLLPESNRPHLLLNADDLQLAARRHLCVDGDTASR